MDADEANLLAAAGHRIHAEPGTPYEPVPGVPGSTLVEQYKAAHLMHLAGDLTDRQSRAVMRRVAEAFPGASQVACETYNDALAEAIALFRHHLRPADRAYLFWRWRHCPCGGCTAISGMFESWFTPDGTEIPGSFDGP